MLGLAESVIFPMAEFQPLSRKAFRWQSLIAGSADVSPQSAFMWERTCR
jgi:hypothetical protein